MGRMARMITFKVQKDIKGAETYFDEYLSSNEYVVSEKVDETEVEIRTDLETHSRSDSAAKAAAKTAKKSADEYHSEGGASIGKWQGKIAARLGLKEGANVNKEEFMRLLKNLHPGSCEQLTARMKKEGERRLYFDATVSAPKSVSILALTMGDKRLEAAHEKAVSAAITELQNFAQTRVRTLGRNEVRRSHEILNAQFTHTTSRSHDPQLHTHNVIFNVTFDPEEKRFKALECFSMYERSNYFTELYRNELAREVLSLGYEIERAKHGWEIKGVSGDLLELFSKRSQDIKKSAAAQEAELGRKLTNGELANVSHKTRSAKDTSMTKDELIQFQLTQMNAQSKFSLETLIKKSFSHLEELKIPNPAENYPKYRTTEDEALDNTIKHVFERQSVLKDHNLLTEAFKNNYGHISLETLKNGLSNHKDLIHIPEAEKVAHRNHLLIEHNICDFVRNTKNTFKPITPIAKLGSDLRQDQKEVYRGVLKSEDKVTAIRGGAGTGKSYLISKLVQNYQDKNMPVLSLAPTSGATQNLKKDLNVEAITMQSYLLDPAKHIRQLKNGVLIIDEAGLVSLKEMNQIFESSKNQDFRILLIGDTRQHQAVKAGDALRVLERYGEMKSHNLIEITRQKDTLYNAAIKDISQKNIERAWSTFEEMGSVHEKSDLGEIRRSIALEYLEKTSSGKSTLIVTPTWDEIKNTTAELREHLKAAYVLNDNEKIEKTTYSSVSFTEAQKSNIKSYIPNDHYITWQKDTEEFKKHSHWKIVEVSENNLTLQSNGLTKSLQLNKIDSKLFDVAEKKLTEIAVGDKILIQSNFRNYKDQERDLTNGQILTVSKILEDGSIKTNEGKIIPKEFDRLDHGYAMTSYGSQGKTCDHVIVSMNIAGGQAISMNQFYVSTSRGRESISIYVDDKEYIREKILKSALRESVMEFLKLEMPKNRLEAPSPKWIDKTRDFFKDIKLKVENIFERDRRIKFTPER
jgi:conjugative relaxase-like TrwC/TraI family protein